MNLEIKVPFIAQASDYHEFQPVARLLSDMTGARIRYKEIDATGGEPNFDVDVFISRGTYYARFEIAD